MATGMTSPLAVTQKGEAQTVSGSALIKQLLITALRDCSSENPFQDLGIGDKLIFDVLDPKTIARLTVRIQQIFARFQGEQLAKLIPGGQGLTFSREEEGELSAMIKYVDLETDKPDEFTIGHDANGWS